LAGSTVGLFATTQSRLFSSAFYAMHDTKTPLKCALIRVALSSTLGYCASQYAPYFLHINTLYGTVGITVASGLSGWVEYRMLRYTLSKVVGKVTLGKRYIVSLWICALIAAGVAYSIKSMLHYHPITIALIVLSLYGIIYFALSLLFKIDEMKNLLSMIGIKK